MQKMFIKLDGVAGESKSPRHFGEIEISAFHWGYRHGQYSAAGGVNTQINDLTIIKTTDKASHILMNAWKTGQNFPKVILTIEELSRLGSMIRSTIYKLESVLVESLTVNKREETITLNFKYAEMVLP